MQGDEKLNNSTSSTSSNSTIEQKSRKDSQNFLQIDQNKYRIYTEEINNKNLNTIEMLTASVSNAIRPEDSIIYSPNYAHILHTKYPAYPLCLRQELIEKLREDTLFFIFFIQQDFEAKEMAFRQLQKRGWMFHTKYNTFFYLQGEPKNKTENSIEGKFKYFDHEKDWEIKKKEFKFELKYYDKH